MEVGAGGSASQHSAGVPQGDEGFRSDAGFCIFPGEHGRILQRVAQGGCGASSLGGAGHGNPICCAWTAWGSPSRRKLSRDAVVYAGIKKRPLLLGFRPR